MCSGSETGQATVEAAVILPVLFAIFGLFLQPVILLYDLAVMQSAAGELCRAAETQTASDASLRAYALRRLGAVPQLEVFHVGGDEGWQVTCEGGQLGEEVQITIAHCVEPLPLFGIGAGLVASRTPDGSLQQSVQVCAALQPSWACALGSDVDGWLEEWE